MATPILQIEDLTKSFRSHWTFRSTPAVRNVSFEVYPGESFGYLGHNGAGKTTTMKCIVGLIHKTQGRILLNGEELKSGAQHSILGYLPELPYFYEHLTVGETLDFFAQLHGIKHGRNKLIDDTLERVSLIDRKNSPVRALSKGLQQRLGFAQAIINQPKLLLLDEPFSGLDPLGRAEFRQLIIDLKRQGTTIFLSSHILSDVEDICDRVAIMVRGELKTVFDLNERARLYGESYEMTIEITPDSVEVLHKLSAMADSHTTQDLINYQLAILRFKTYAEAQAALTLALGSGVQVDRFESCGLSLEEIFINITSKDMPQQKSKTKDSAETQYQVGEAR